MFRRFNKRASNCWSIFLKFTNSEHSIYKFISVWTLNIRIFSLQIPFCCFRLQIPFKIWWNMEYKEKREKCFAFWWRKKIKSNKTILEMHIFESWWSSCYHKIMKLKNFIILNLSKCPAFRQIRFKLKSISASAWKNFPTRALVLTLANSPISFRSLEFINALNSLMHK